MTDLNSIFETPPASGGQVNPPEAGKPKKKSGKKASSANGGPKRRGPRRTPVTPQAAARPPLADEPAPKRTRKPRAASAKRGRPASPASGGRGADKGVKLDLTTMMGALVGLKAQDAALVGKITQALGTVNKKSRARVLEAVGRIFA